MYLVKKHLPYSLLILSLIVGGFLRFYKLDWGQGYFFHPDEYHIVGAVGRLLNTGLSSNPKLFSYGSFTVYIIYLARWVLYSLTKAGNIDIFIIGRFLSALFSTLTLINIFFIAKNIFPNRRLYPEMAVLTSAFIPGLIQQAHFLTPESFMTFWITLSAYFFIRYFSKYKLKELVFSGVFMGLAGGTKITALTAIPFILVVILLLNIKKSGIIKNLQKVVLYLALVFLFLISVFPYSVLDYENFKNTTRYESSLSAGSVKVFYTRSFNNSVPFLFQIKQIYPYTLGIIMTVFAFVGIAAAIISYFSNKKRFNNYYIPLLGIFLSYFIFNSLLFTKWTRFVHPTIPFLVIFSFTGIYEIAEQLKNPNTKKYLEILLLCLLIIPTVVWGIMFFSIYQRDDVRVTATDWVNKNIENDQLFLSETGNTLEIPLRGNYTIIPFDFYNVDTNPALYINLINDIYKSDYFIIQSRRIYYNHDDKIRFPTVYNFYNALFSGRLGFKEIKYFSSFPKLEIGNWNLEIRDEDAEETWSVFDHPVIKIFKKSDYYAEEYYKLLLPQ